MNNRVLEEQEDVFGDITAQLSGSEYALLKNKVERFTQVSIKKKTMGSRPNTILTNSYSTQKIFTQNRKI